LSITGAGFGETITFFATSTCDAGGVSECHTSSPTSRQTASAVRRRLKRFIMVENTHHEANATL
jgi:hypothetical protein